MAHQSIAIGIALAPVFDTDGAAGGGSGPSNGLLLETGEFILQETGDFILQE